STAPEDPGLTIWKSISSDAVSEQIPEVEARLSGLYQVSLSTSQCQTHQAALKHYLERLPIDLTNWNIARQCAERLGDSAWLSESQHHLDSLLQYATNAQRGLVETDPIPVLHVYDIEVIAEAKNLDIKWLRYLQMTDARHLLVQTSMQTHDGQQVRYYFDLLDALVRLSDDNEVIQYPIGRRILAFTSMETETINGDALALTGNLYMDVETGQSNPNSARRALETAWESGVLGAGISLIELCLAVKEAACEAPLIESVITTLQEQELAEGWSLAAAEMIVLAGLSYDHESVVIAREKAAQLSEANDVDFYLASVVAPDLNSASAHALAQSLGLTRSAAALGSP
ncbi:MAG: hypothetical protein AAGH65_01105, partial [Pseudomonadota bacterium]